MASPLLGLAWGTVTASAAAYRGQRGMPDRPHERPTTILTIRFPSAPGPRETALAVADKRAALNSIDVRDAMPEVYASL